MSRSYWSGFVSDIATPKPIPLVANIQRSDLTFPRRSWPMENGVVKRTTMEVTQIIPTIQSSQMKMSKVGNQTNSQDPQAVNSRVFVGNLNTFQCSKTDVERMFQRYGRLVGISMHKGYAFVQFTNPFDARGACLGEDGRTVLGQTLDVNMVAEPKPHQTGRKRQNVAKTGNDWDYYYDSYYASAFGGPRMVPPIKRPRLTPMARPKPKPALQLGTTQIKTYSKGTEETERIEKNGKGVEEVERKEGNPDILICGNCREMFNDLQEILDHKKEFCKLRFTCKCSAINGSEGEDTWLLCVQCKEGYHNAWDLMVHVQAAHMLNIYQLGNIKNASSERLSPQLQENDAHLKQQNDEEGKDQFGSPTEDEDVTNHESCIIGALSIEPTSDCVAVEVNNVANGELNIAHE